MWVTVFLTRCFLQLTAGVKLTDYCWAERPSYKSLECGVWNPQKHYSLQRRIQDTVAYYWTLSTWPWYTNNENYHTNTLVLLYWASDYIKSLPMCYLIQYWEQRCPKDHPMARVQLVVILLCISKCFPLYSQLALWQIFPQEGQVQLFPLWKKDNWITVKWCCLRESRPLTSCLITSLKVSLLNLPCGVGIHSVVTLTEGPVRVPNPSSED